VAAVRPRRGRGRHGRRPGRLVRGDRAVSSPLGIPIPHTAIIPHRKDEIGRTLGEFVETNFLEAGVVRAKLESTPIARTAGAWLRDPAHAETVAAEASTVASGILRASATTSAGSDQRPRA
jgi:uncharacterized membrane-anchored protein YjiN (DUF445 family)